MSIGIKERVARAIYDHSPVYCRTEPWTTLEERDREPFYVMADAAISSSQKKEGDA